MRWPSGCSTSNRLLFATARRKLLVVLQGMDSSGKDGTIKHVFKMVNPLGVRVANFKRPNDVELAHDYLWRVHHNVPRRGDITIFNRSHYEDVLVVRVHDLVPEKVWRRRYAPHPSLGADAGRRGHGHPQVLPAHLPGRAECPPPGTARQPGQALEVRARRHRGAPATGTSTPPPTRTRWPRRPPPTRRGTWCPSDQKWFRNLVISTVLVETLESMELTYPEASPPASSSSRSTDRLTSAVGGPAAAPSPPAPRPNRWSNRTLGGAFLGRFRDAGRVRCRIRPPALATARRALARARAARPRPGPPRRSGGRRRAFVGRLGPGHVDLAGQLGQVGQDLAPGCW